MATIDHLAVGLLVIMKHFVLVRTYISKFCCSQTFMHGEFDMRSSPGLVCILFFMFCFVFCPGIFTEVCKSNLTTAQM